MSSAQDNTTKDAVVSGSSASNQCVMHVTSLEKSIWSELKVNLATTLKRLDIEILFEPTVCLLYDYISTSVKTLHCGVFKQIIDTDFGIGVIDDSHEPIDELYQQEIATHGDRNIARYCDSQGLGVVLAFPEEDDVIISISIPTIFYEDLKFDRRLTEILGYQLCTQETERDSIHYTNTIIRFQSKKHKACEPTLLTPDEAQNSFQNIFSHLNYDVICFSSIGEILSVSPSILTKLGMKTSELSIQAFKELIPAHFYNDVVWGLALDEPYGIFENYRSRLTSKMNQASILFNVSGYRDDNNVIHTLWQAVSYEKKENSKLSEGSILTEARVHNITRNYVPQLVEEKARETVRLGGTKLINEECHIAVLFCDIVGFTAYVEENENEESVIHTLNSILHRISKSVKEYGGLIDKFMGDCVMVLFRNPHDAVVAAHKMQQHSTDINLLRERAGQGTLKLRIGIHWGKVVIGNVGTPERLDWTTIGDVVNTASRIEKNCRPGAVLISEHMQREIQTEAHGDLAFSDTFYLEVKGKKDALAVCYTDLA